MLEGDMERIVLGKTGLEVNRLGFGGIPIQRVDEKQAVEAVVHAINGGVDFIDTARAYTTSEHRIGLALKETEKEVFLATKSHEKTTDGVAANLEISLKELQRDYIDIYQCHGIKDKEDYKHLISSGGVFDFLQKKKEEGIIGHIGATSHNLDLVDKIIDDGLFETIMICFSFLEPAAQEKIIPKAIRNGFGVIAMKPFSGGVIEKSTLALKYVLRVPEVLVLAGVEKKEFFDENWKVFQGKHNLEDSENKEIEEIRQLYNKKFCRRCDYCQPCTEDIPIQFVLGMRSLVKRMGTAALYGDRLKGMIEKAKECSECGECESRCPYELPVRELIKENVQWVEDQKKSFSKEAKL
jgi:predicted aldo/keto reductase-like oxidoreductase